MGEKFLLSGIWNPEVECNALCLEVRNLENSFCGDSSQTLVDTLKLEHIDGNGMSPMWRFVNEPGQWTVYSNVRQELDSITQRGGSSGT